MPCSDSLGYGHSYEDKLYIDKLTRLLCEACKHLEEATILEYASTELKEWHKQHKQEDLKKQFPYLPDKSIGDV